MLIFAIVVLNSCAGRFDKDKETKTYFIKDSEHFAMFDREAYIYKYAVLTGCLDELKDVTDIAISEKLTAAQEMYNYNYEKISLYRLI